MPDELTLVAIAAQRYHMSPMLYACTRTSDDLNLDLRAALATVMVPAQLLMGQPKKGRRRPGPNGSQGKQHNFGQKGDWVNRLRRPLSDRSYFVELPGPGQKAHGDKTRATMMANSAANSITRLGKKRSRSASFVMPQPPAFKGPGPVIRRPKR